MSDRGETAQSERAVPVARIYIAVIVFGLAIAFLLYGGTLSTSTILLGLVFLPALAWPFLALGCMSAMIWGAWRGSAGPAALGVLGLVVWMLAAVVLLSLSVT